jgi:hypothetical protein
MKHFRMLAAGLCSAVLLCGFAIPAYAYSDGGNEEPPVVEETPAPEPAPTITPGEGFSEDGNLVTRDLLYDAATNKQFITVETNGGSTFYIVIDYDKPVDEDGEQYHTYFLNMVDEADLLAALEAAGGELPACSCTEKCAPGAIHTDCAVCAVNMTECAGTAPDGSIKQPAPFLRSNLLRGQQYIVLLTQIKFLLSACRSRLGGVVHQFFSLQDGLCFRHKAVSIRLSKLLRRFSIP